MSTVASELMTDLLASAVRAPSPYNTQPWRFVVRGNRIDVLLDRGRVLAVADPDAREARLACGAALLNLRLAVRAAGKVADVAVLPERSNPDLLASVSIGGTRPPTPAEVRLAKAIERRHTNRHPFLERSVEPAARYALAAAARAEGAWLELIDQSERYDVVAELIRRADRVQEDNPAYAREFRRWTGGPLNRRDGVPIDAIGPAPDTERALRLRSFYRPSPIPPRRFEQQPLLAAILTNSTGSGADITAGCAMQRVLLTACDLGLASSFISQPFEVAETRAELNAAFPEGEIHTLLRIGYGYETGPTPRRAVDEVVSPPIG